MRHFLVPLLLTLAVLSGCMDDAPATTDDVRPGAFPEAQFQGEPAQGTPAGTATDHGEPKVEESAVETGGTPLQFRGSWARKTVTITNGFGGASAAVVSIGISAGGITVEPWSGDGYELVAVLQAEAETEQQARDELERISLSHDDQLEGNELRLTTGVRYEPSPAPVPFFPFIFTGNAWTTSVLTLKVPAGPAYDLWESAASGDVSASGLRGPLFRLDTSSGSVSATGLNAGKLAIEVSSGDVSLERIQAGEVAVTQSSGDLVAVDVVADALVADASSGSMDVAGRFPALRLSAGSGDITVAAVPTASGNYTLSASSGAITLSLLADPTVGYDIDAETSSGSVSIDLPDTAVTDGEEGAKHARSNHFDAAAVQTVVEASTSSGDITIAALAPDAGIL